MNPSESRNANPMRQFIQIGAETVKQVPLLRYASDAFLFVI
jgi:hypothetical protein